MRSLLVALAISLLSTQSYATPDLSGQEEFSAPRSSHIELRRVRGTTTNSARSQAVLDQKGVIGGRPSGCPRRYCGCGASLRVFKRIIPHLNLAWNWSNFPRTSAASGMVAVRRGHVFVLESHVSGSTWLVHDSNSGGGKTRIHHRSIAGYIIVNPHGNSYAQAR